MTFVFSFTSMDRWGNKYKIITQKSLRRHILYFKSSMCHKAISKISSHKRQLTPTARVAKAQVTVHPVSVRMENKWLQVHYAAQEVIQTLFSAQHCVIGGKSERERTLERTHIFFELCCFCFPLSVNASFKCTHIFCV